MNEALLNFTHRLASPRHFYQIAGRLLPWVLGLSLLLILAGFYGGLVLAPPDYQQGDSFRIIYLHVPAAWMSLFVYVLMALCSAIGLIWQIKMAFVIATVSAPIGASFTFIALTSGAIWGKPMWGTWWVWDARLTSELLLLFLYLGYIGLRAAIEDRRLADKATSVLALVGVVNVPIIHFSVEWWNTLHQGSTVLRSDGPAIATEMLIPLLITAVGFKVLFLGLVLLRGRTEILLQERRSSWVKELLSDHD